MAILVIGGGGYIGSHMIKRLLAEDEDIIILDDFSKGYRDAILGGTVLTGDFGDTGLLDQICQHQAIDVVMVFASFIEVGESVAQPARYYRNNVASFFVLLDSMIRHGVERLVFSSSAAVYGESRDARISEDHPCHPVSPYGRSKLMIEQALEDCARAYGLGFYALRYFNAAGADPATQIGERHDPETHLIPLILQAASGRRDAIKVFGRDYPTKDGTCERDYVHVEDICQAHWLATRALRDGAGGGFYNLGNMSGYSVAEVINTAQEVTGRKIRIEDAPARPGDPAVLVADGARIRDNLDWRPEFSDLSTIIEHAWKWELEKGRLW